MKLALCEQMRGLDQTAITLYRIPGIVLMENAAVSIFNICKTLQAYKAKKVLIFCGTGSNGGDGFALARHMLGDGSSVSIVLVGPKEKISGDALAQYEICEQLGIRTDFIDNLERIKTTLNACELVVDAMLGTGAAGVLRSPISDAVTLINESGKFTLAVDIPTGGNADNGQISGVCVKADMTVTLGLVKPGLLLYPLADFTGKIGLGGIGAAAVFDAFEATHFALDTQSAAALLPKRRTHSHKGTYGKAAIVAGSRNMAGAAAFCAKAAYAMGCGYVNICAPESIIETLQILAPQAISTSIPEKNGFLYEASTPAVLDIINKYTVCLIGPGLGNNQDTAAFVKQIIREAAVPLIIDADALNVIADEPDVLKAAAHPPVITPHILEISRLSGLPVDNIANDVLKVAEWFSKQYNCITVLKDATTVIAGANKTYINKGGVSALAKAGSGDILAGIITALAGQGLEQTEAAALGAYIHTRSGIAAASKLGDYSVSADDIIGCIHIAVGELVKTRH